VIEFRRKGLGIYATMPGDRKPQPFIEDAAIPIEHLAAYVPQVLEVCRRHGAPAVLYGHASVGVLHIRPLLDLKRSAGVAAYRAIADEVFELVRRYGGSWSGEHGDGLIRSEKNRAMFGDTLYEAFREVKRAFDPEGVWNPGKIVDAPPMTEHLRYARRTRRWPCRRCSTSAPRACSGRRRPAPASGRAGRRGSARCAPRSWRRGTRRTARAGRANVLREAIVGGLPGGLTSREVHDVLDLCLECKACKAECPSRVDVGKLKSEFLQAWYDAHGTPLAARAIGGIARIAPWAQAVAPLANALLPLPAVRWLTERAIGVDRRRTLPRYARAALRPHARRPWRRAGRRASAPEPLGAPVPAADDAPTVALFVDTWSNFHDTGPAHAAAGGPPRGRGGGRSRAVPLLRSPAHLQGPPARGAHPGGRQRRRPHPLRRTGVPVLGLEPSCVSAFTDDYPDLVPGPATQALARHVRPLEAWLAKRWTSGRLRPDALFERSDTPVLLHGHCQQKAVLGTAPTVAVLGWTAREVRELDAGCCGMAGSFGYTHHDLSLAIGEQRLFPAVRAHAGDVVACGFSCRHQVADGTGVRPRHVAEALAGALRRT
jgi:Fe-S oxidoreductase